MKKFIICLLYMALALPAFLASAQEAQETKAWTGTYYASKQSSYTPSFENDGSEAEIRNVILMIGDGMGWGAVNTAHYANGGTLTMTNLRTMGLVRTQSADNYTTDSAASGTAYATGFKTNNGYLGMSPELEKLENLTEKLTELGYVCGVLSTDELHGATPAAFYAHQSARGEYDAIWKDLVGAKLIFASAGSKDRFGKLETRVQDELSREYTLVHSIEECEAAAGSAEKLLFLPETVATVERGDYLPRTTRLALEYLDSRAEKGFFLMVEGARIDKNEHNSDLKGTIWETLDFDKAVEEAIRFAEKDGHTLVIISADHETGALSMTQCNTEDGFVRGVYASRGHSPMMVPLFAFGPGSQEFTGVQENSDVSNKIYELLK